MGLVSDDDVTFCSLMDKESMEDPLLFFRCIGKNQHLQGFSDFRVGARKVQGLTGDTICGKLLKSNLFMEHLLGLVFCTSKNCSSVIPFC